jgi:hypothetical protein
MYSLDSQADAHEDLSVEKSRMSKAELEHKVLLILQASHESFSSSAVLQTARERWHVGDLDVREAIWGLLESYQIELTADRRLKAKSSQQVAV